MENEELAALRATLLASQRQPFAHKARQARLSALLSAGEELLPYVLAPSCSDPRDRLCRRDDLIDLRVVEGRVELPPARGLRMRETTSVYEAPPATPLRVAVVLACVFLLGLLAQVISMLMLHLR